MPIPSRGIVREIVGDDPERLESFRAAGERVTAAWQIRSLRRKLDLTQQEVAERVGTTASAIARFESAKYAGHSLRKLEEIAAALDADVAILLVPRGHRAEVKPASP